MIQLVVAFSLFALIDASAAVLTSKGMKQIGEISTLKPRELMEIVRRALKTPPLLIGFGMDIINFFLFLAILSWADLSLVIPVVGAASYLISIAGAKILLKEDVTIERWLGTVLIVLGVVFVGL